MNREHPHKYKESLKTFVTSILGKEAKKDPKHFEERLSSATNRGLLLKLAEVNHYSRARS